MLSFRGLKNRQVLRPEQGFPHAPCIAPRLSEHYHKSGMGLILPALTSTGWKAVLLCLDEYRVSTMTTRRSCAIMQSVVVVDVVRL